MPWYDCVVSQFNGRYWAYSAPIQVKATSFHVAAYRALKTVRASQLKGVRVYGLSVQLTKASRPAAGS